METQYISLNMTPTGVNPCFHISQYDVGRMLGFIVHSGGATVDLDTYTCTIEATRSDGTAITSAVATTDNIGTFEVTPTMSNKTDKYRCQLVIVDANSKRIASLPFDMDVCKAAMDENSESIEEDASLYQQYNASMQAALANEASLRTNADTLLELGKISKFNTVAQMKADATLVNGMYAKTGGYYSVNDGGKALYRISNTKPSKHYETLSNGLYAEIIYDDIVNVKQFGAKGDGSTNDTNAFKMALLTGKPVFIPNGDYLITDNLTVNNDIFGEDKYYSHLIFSGLTSGTYAITIGAGYTALKNFRITSTDTTQTTGTSIDFNGINTTGKIYVLLEDVYISNFNRGLDLGDNSWNNNFVRLMITYCNNGIYLASECNDDAFYDCLVKSCKTGFHKIAGLTVTIQGGDFSYNETAVKLEDHGDLNLIGVYFELNKNYSVYCTFGMSAFESINVSDCSFTENNTTTRIFYFNGNSSSKASIKNCFFKNVGNTTIVVAEFITTDFKPIFLDCQFIGAFTLDKERADFNNSRIELLYKDSDGISFTANGIGFKTYTVPTTPTGYTLISKEFYRTDDGGYNLIVYCPMGRNYLVYYSQESINVYGYVKCVYALFK